MHIAAPSAAGGVVIALLLFLFLARRRSKRKSKYNDGDPIYAEVGGRDGLTRFLLSSFLLEEDIHPALGGLRRTQPHFHRLLGGWACALSETRGKEGESEQVLVCPRG